jgi:hypothetical protein
MVASASTRTQTLRKNPTIRGLSVHPILHAFLGKQTILVLMAIRILQTFGGSLTIQVLRMVVTVVLLRPQKWPGGKF